MTARQLYEGVLIELDKDNAPNILLEGFNYFANKALNQYINKRYNIYDVNQQTTDDLRVLKATAILNPKRLDDYDSLSLVDGGMATYYVDLPSDYLHLLNCICIYNVRKTYKCYNKGDTWRCAATRLTSDAYSQVLDNFWNKPSYKKPYYYIHNINLNESNPTNPYNSSTGYGTDAYNIITDSSDTDGRGHLVGEVENGLPDTLDFVNPSGENPTKTISTVQRAALVRYGNPSTVRLEIRYGTDNSVFTLDLKDENGNWINAIKDQNNEEIGSKGGKIYIDYIKTPLHIRLTQEELDYTEDKSLIIEFPDYVCQEIINELVHIILENISDPRLQTHPVVSLSIANPAQALTPQAAQDKAAQ